MKLRLQSIRLPLAEFDLEIDAEITAPVTGIFGPSGAGKTSLLDLIAGIRKPRRGRIELDGRELDNVETRLHVPSRARHIGYVPQENALFPHLKVRQNLLYGAREVSPSEVEHVVEVLAIGGLMDRGVVKLSGGEQKRVALGRALLASPRLLLLDEPLAALERPLHARITELLERIRDELRVPMLYVTHDASELGRIADTVLILERGRVASQGKTREILSPAGSQP